MPLSITEIVESWMVLAFKKKKKKIIEIASNIEIPYIEFRL